MRLTFAVLALSLALLPSARAQTANWEKFQPPGGGFQIDMPGKPNVKSDEKDGHKTDTALVAIDKAVAGADLVFIVKYQARTGAPGPETPAILEAVFKAMTDGNTVLSDKQDPIGGYPAREFAMQDADKDTYQVRVVFTDRYFIEAIFLGPADNQLGKRFLDSFTVAKSGG
jgi:pullulanase/glycogen debranching enzyme